MKEYQKPFQMNSYEKHRFDLMFEQCGDEIGGQTVEEINRMAFDYWLRWKIKTDLFFFGNEVMGWRHARGKKNPKRWRVDPKFHRWMTGVLMLKGDKLIQVPRFHLKTTWVKLRIIQLILIDPLNSILLSSVTTKLVRRELADIKRMFATEILLRLFKQQIPKPGNNYINWSKSTQDELTLIQDDSLGKVPQESQITVVGADTRITGFHFGYGFFDDPVDDSTVRTAEQMLKSEEWWEFMQPILDTDAEITWTCTPYHYNDLSAKIIKEKQIERIFHRSNIENGKPVYKSWYTLKDFEKLKVRMGSYNYSCQIECNATPDEEKIFQPPQPTFPMPLPDDVKGYRYYLLIDPAATIQSYSDKTAFVIIAVNHINQVFVLESFSFKRAGNEIADLLIKKQLQYSFKMIGIELGLQTHLDIIIDMKIVEWERENKPKKLKIKKMPIPITKQNKRYRIGTTLGSLVRTGKIRINANCMTLLRQMDMFTGKEGDEDNEIDALSMCVYVIESFAQHRNLDKEFKSPGMTWQDFHDKKRRTGWSSRFAS